ncbi:hypothetical protein DFJ73DRAFT_757790 [Zopfochytrium polystomum]|nr:hypothetical protein DFJ73DRAFT_757790 [Zopfochytrium polystomum]
MLVSAAASSLLVASAAAFVRAASFGGSAFDIAAGAITTASSTWNSGLCAGSKYSEPKPCTAGLNETIKIDWFTKYKIEYLTEVRFRFGPVASGSQILVLFSEEALNVAEPTAVTYTDDNLWTVFLFTQPVTASGLQLILTNLKSPDGTNCYTSVAEIQAWIGPAPDGALATPSDSSASKRLSGGFIALIVLAVIAAVVGLLVFWFLRVRRLNLIKTRLAINRERPVGDQPYETSLSPLASQGAAPATVLPKTNTRKNKNNTLSPRMANFLESQQLESQSADDHGFLPANGSE